MTTDWNDVEAAMRRHPAGSATARVSLDRVMLEVQGLESLAAQEREMAEAHERDGFPELATSLYASAERADYAARRIRRALA